MRDIKPRHDLYSVFAIVAHCFMGTRLRVGGALWLTGDANPLEDSWVCLTRVLSAKQGFSSR